MRPSSWLFSRTSFSFTTIPNRSSRLGAALLDQVCDQPQCMAQIVEHNEYLGTVLAVHVGATRAGQTRRRHAFDRFCILDPVDNIGCALAVTILADKAFWIHRQ